LASKYRIGWNVPYQAGELMVRAYRNGAEVASKTVSTAGQPARLELQADRPTISADGIDLSFVTVRVVDENGTLCPLANPELTFKVEGAGELEALGSGNPISLESFQSDKRKAFNGLALAIIRSRRNHSGAIVLNVMAEGIPAATIILQSNTLPSQ
jgi:beta-galactosidase